MDSPTSSVKFEGDERDVEKLRRPQVPGIPPAVPQLPSLELEAEPIAQADEDRKREEERDFAVAKQLDEILKISGDLPDAAESSRTSARSSGGGFFSSSGERQIDKLKEKNALYKRKCEEMEKLAFQWQQRARENHSQANRYYSEARFLQMEVASSQKHVHHLDTELKAAEHKLRVVEQQLSDAVNLSEVRGKELKGAQVFLTKADTFSIPEVVRKVTALNEEIFQMAAFLGEVLVYEVLEEGADRAAVRQHAAEKLLGEVLANALAQESAHEPREPSNPLLVQIVMQIALTHWCASLASRWTSYQKPDKEGEGGEGKQGEQKEAGGSSSTRRQVEYDNMLRDLYDSIRDHEEQAVAGRWRSLARTHLPFSAHGWDNTLMVGIISVMSVAGWAPRAPEELGQIEKRLASIFKPLLELRKATGEDVTSADLDIAIIEPRAQFDPRFMEDEYADGRASSRSSNAAPESVVSTSGLGLKKLSVKKLKEGGVQRHIEMLALPKVVLERTVKEALEPHRRRRRRRKLRVGRVVGPAY
ncbi:hypothetical protein FA13DRAFT_1725598 [Coprinellus micaceus]|uniref:Uncharacterized protein n=1 Tax=Coprinellus micaceus TaxID=71717 RepID=A0A4Y7TVF8_COPMI|nr:hypothetical protein FA13DRAFT_1725598 [Coprinellus micaceus]